MKVTDDMISNELNATDRLNNLEKYKTARKKMEFINDIKGGLGTEMKSNPNKIKLLNNSFGDKVKKFFAKLFTKF